MRNENELGAVLRTGRVTEFDPKKHAARVFFWDIEEQESDWLPILVKHSHVDKYEGYADVGEKVVCLMSGQGDEFGVILGSFYDEVCVPEVAAPETQTLAFGDGTHIQYDRSAHTLLVSCKDEITIKADGKITIRAGDDITVHTDKTLLLKGKNVNIEGGEHIKETAPRIDLN